MRSVQTKFFDLLKERASAAGFEVVTYHSFSNVGVIHLQKPGSFETALSIPFDFQSNAHFGWTSDRGESHPVFPDRPNPRFAGFEANELDNAIWAIIKYAKEQTKAVAS